MIFSQKRIVMTYHGLHSRAAADVIDDKLFRNSISENDYLSQIKILKKFTDLKIGENGAARLVHKDLFFNQYDIVLTFDDGYQNNLKAAEIFRDEFETTSLTIFLTTALIGQTNQSIWTVNVALLILRGNFSSGKLVFGEQDFPLDNAAHRLECFDKVRRQLKKMTAGERGANYDSIISQTIPGELERLLFEYPEFKMLNLDEIRQMSEIGVKFEPHGHNHEILHANQSDELISSEVLESKKFIETNIGQQCSFFAYPNGDYCDAAVKVLKENKFAGAYTTKIGAAENLVNNFEIPRITPNSKAYKFKKQLRGKFI